MNLTRPVAAAFLSVTLVACAYAQPARVATSAGRLSSADTALVGRILLAEDRRDSTDRALRDGMTHRDPRVNLLARRALGRIRDPRFAARDSLPPLAPAPTWPEPAWRLRLRALTPLRDDCAALRTALGDAAWQVRLRAMDLVTRSCAADDAIAVTLRETIDALPADVSTRRTGQVSWHAAAHALVALARSRPGEARPRTARVATHAQWNVRQYAARAAGVLADTTLLRTLAADHDANVREAAIESLARVAGHSADDVYLEALDAAGAQVAHAAAAALKGTMRDDARAAARRTFDRYVERANASERDVRVALLAVLGEPATNDRPPAIRVDLPRDAVALALGADIRLRVTMSAMSGGGSFVVRLRGDAAPMMAARILALVREHHYDGYSWHRVEHDFVIQGGSPGANEYVGLAQFLRDELATIPHPRGTVGMSTRGHDTGDAQWFVNLRDNQRLGRDYTVWAEVVEGIEVVDGVFEGDVIDRITVEPTGSGR